MKIEKLTPWLPLLIAAGYFLFLVATWQRFIMSENKIRELLTEIESRHDIRPADGNSDQ